MTQYAPYALGATGLLAGLGSLFTGGGGSNGGYGNGGYGGQAQQNALLEYLKQNAPNTWYKSKNWGKPYVS